MELTQLIEVISSFVPYILLAAVLALGGVLLHSQGQFDNFLRTTVSAVYRVAIAAAAELSDTGLQWLRSEDGINYRKGLVYQAYDLIPPRLGPVPVGLLKLLVSREQFASLVEQAFQEMADLAEELKPPADIDPTLQRLFPEE